MRFTQTALRQTHLQRTWMSGAPQTGQMAPIPDAAPAASFPGRFAAAAGRDSRSRMAMPSAAVT